MNREAVCRVFSIVEVQFMSVVTVRVAELYRMCLILMRGKKIGYVIIVFVHLIIMPLIFSWIRM